MCHIGYLSELTKKTFLYDTTQGNIVLYVNIIMTYMMFILNS